MNGWERSASAADPAGRHPLLGPCPHTPGVGLDEHELAAIRRDEQIAGRPRPRSVTEPVQSGLTVYLPVLRMNLVIFPFALTVMTPR